MQDDLGNRMKAYEHTYVTTLPLRQPTVLRVDGKAFHSYTKGLKWSQDLATAMDTVALTLCQEIQGAVLAYVQSDEISVLLHTYTGYNTQTWFGGEVQKMVSVSASMAAAIMTQESPKVFGKVKPAYFDSRAFVLPTPMEAHNYFVWRQQDAMRNSVQMLARSLYPHYELYQKNIPKLKEMIIDKGGNWDTMSHYYQRGRCILRAPHDNGRDYWTLFTDIPIFTEDPHFIQDLLVVDNVQ